MNIITKYNIAVVFMILVILVAYFVYHKGFNINNEMHLDNYNIVTISELFKPYVEQYSRRINDRLYLQEVIIIPRNYINFTYESYNDKKLHICEICAEYDNDKWTIKRLDSLWDPKISKLSSEDLSLEKWNYDVRYFADSVDRNITSIKQINAKYQNIKIQFNDCSINANPISGEIQWIM